MSTTVGILAGGRTAEKASTERTAEHTRQTLEANGFTAEVIMVSTVAEQVEADLLARLRSVDVVLPLISGLEGFMAAIDVPYVGSMPLAASLGAHKGLFNDLLKLRGLKIVAFWHGPAVDAEASVRSELSLPVFVKPCRLGASYGISRVNSWDDLQEAVRIAAIHDDQVLVEEAVTAPVREFGVCGIVHPDRVVWSRACEVMLPEDAPWHDNDSKYSGGTDFKPVEDESLAQALKDVASQAVAVAEFGGAVRVDLFLDGRGRIGVGEINCVPGYGPYADTPRIFEESGVPRSELFGELVVAAAGWSRERSTIRYSM